MQLLPKCLLLLLLAVASAERILAEDPGALEPKDQHPLDSAVMRAQKSLDYMAENVRDYTCLVVRRERIEGELSAHEYFEAKVRHPQTVDGETTPFSIYLKFLAPNSVKHREVLYVDGQNDNKILVHKGGRSLAYIRASLDPEGPMAMKNSRYPVTAFGLQNLLLRLVAVAEEDIASTAVVDVKLFKDAKVNDRVCTGIEVTHPRQEDSERFHSAKVYMDDELQVPVHFESYAWPDAAGEPQLLEQYTYTKIRLNVGLTDADFDPDNPEYDLKRRD